MRGAVFPRAAHEATAVAGALDHAGEAGGVLRLVGPHAERPASCHFLLHIVEGLPVYDGLVGIGHKVLRQFAVILFALAVNGVSDVFLLKEQVAGVGDVGENALDGRILKVASVDGANALGVQLPRCLQP